MKRFYYAADWGFARYADVENVLISAGTMYNKGKLSINRGMIPDTVKRLFVDSGGYSMFRKWGNFPFTTDEYIDFVDLLMDDYPVTEVATMDLPCEPSVNRHTFRTNIDRIKRTIEYADELLENPNIPWVPVVQGYTLNEYKACVNLLNGNAGAMSAKTWAIGTLCARKKTGGIRNIVVNLRKEIDPSIELHSFGLAINALRDPQVFFSIDSSDSGTWSFNGRAHEKPAHLRLFKKRMKSLMDGFMGQTIL